MTPFSEINSPNQTNNIVPAVIVTAKDRMLIGVNVEIIPWLRSNAYIPTD